MLSEITEQIKRWQNTKQRELEERYPRWVFWLREWQIDYKPLKEYSYIDFMEWKTKNLNRQNPDKPLQKQSES